MTPMFLEIGGSGIVLRTTNGDSKGVDGRRPAGIGRNTAMHDILVALSLSALAFMPCVVTMDEDECDMDEETV
jgi:hypothetical protein